MPKFRLRFEFEHGKFEPGECWACQLAYYENVDNPYACVLPIYNEEAKCPLEKVEE